MYLAIITAIWIIGCIVDDERSSRRKRAKQIAKAIAAHKPVYVPMSESTLRANLAQPTVWGPGKPWKTEAEYRNAIQVAQWDKARRLSASA